jgi:hypothetical protein
MTKLCELFLLSGFLICHAVGWYIELKNQKFWYLFLYSYESEFLQKLVKDKKIHEARAFNFTYRYIDDVLSINNSRFAEFLPLIYPPELEVNETTDTASSASCLDLLRHTLIKKNIFDIFVENPSFIIFSAETEYISTRSWYRPVPSQGHYGFQFSGCWLILSVYILRVLTFPL